MLHLLALFALWAGAQEMYTNPVTTTTTSSPFIFLHEGQYVMITELSSGNVGYGVHTSADLVSWTAADNIFVAGKRPSHITNGGLWSARMYTIQNALRFYYSYYNANSVAIIGVASPTALHGDYSAGVANLVGVTNKTQHPSVGFSASGDPYLFFDLDSSIAVVALSADGNSIRGTPEVVLAKEFAWEESEVWGASVHHRNGYYYLFYECGIYSSPLHAIGVARSTSITGPYEKMPGPLMSNPGRYSKLYSRPGAPQVLELSADSWYLVYHAWGPLSSHSSQDSADYRRILMDKIFWDDGWPIVGTQSSPSNTAQIRPLDPSESSETPEFHLVPKALRVSIQTSNNWGCVYLDSETLLKINGACNVDNAFLVREGKQGKGTISFEKVGKPGFFMHFDCSTDSTNLLKYSGTGEHKAAMSFLVFAGVNDATKFSFRPYSCPLRLMRHSNTYIRATNVNASDNFLYADATWSLTAYPCEAGQTFDDSTHACVSCGMMMYSDGITCKQITPVADCKQYSMKADACIKCPNGNYVDTGSNSCKDCPIGTYSTTGETCTACTFNEGCTACFADSGKCSACAGGYSYSSTDYACNPCPGNTFGTDGLKCREVTNCTDGTPAQTTPSCTTCELGNKAEGGECVVCPEKTFGGDGKECTTIEHCDEGPIGLEEPGCVRCALGYNITRGSCVPCHGSTYGTDGKTCTPVENCENGTQAQSVPSCTKCISGYFADGGGCVPCPEKTYGEDGVNCIDIINCTKGEAGQSKPLCSNCTLGNRIDSGRCTPCPGNSYGDNGEFCTPVSNCEEGFEGQEKPSCTGCSRGFKIADGTCEPCPGNTYGTNGVTCVPIELCISGLEGKDRPSCTECEAGYEHVDGKCSACPTDTQSSDGKKCLPCEFPAGCTSCSAKDGLCLSCEAGYGYDQSNRICTLCEQGTYSNGAGPCQPVKDVKYCKEYWTVQNKCRTCDLELMVSYDNQCRECFNGEEAVGGECVPCGENEYSIVGETMCTSDCEEFSGFDNACLDSNFCKISLGRCVPEDDNRVLIFGCSAGALLLLIVVLIVVIILVKRSNWRKEKKKRKAIEMAMELEALVFASCSAGVDCEPHILLFGEKAVGCDETLEDELKICNRGKKAVEFGVTWDENGPMSIEVQPVYGFVKGGSEAVVKVRASKSQRGDVRSQIKVSVMLRKNDGKHFDIDLLMKGRQEYEIGSNELTLADKIGEGACGIVFKGMYDGNTVAIKKLKKTDKQARAAFEREVEMLKLVHGLNVVTFYGAVLEGDNICHVTEYMDLGTLTEMMKHNQINGRAATKIMRDVANGMATVHSFDVIHRDLKPDNVLCKSPLDVSNEDLCKITDFGTSRTAENVFAMTMTKGQGTPLYMAPEILSGQKHYTKAVDVYSFGILCACVWNNGALPYSEYNFPNPLELQNAVVSGCRPQIFVEVPEDIMAVIMSCWDIDPGVRPPFTAIAEMAQKCL